MARWPFSWGRDVGGVGSFAVEALARAFVGHLTLIDFDEIKASNINRQIHASTLTVGQGKVEVMAQRVREINPGCDVVARRVRLLPESLGGWLQEPWDYVVDAIDDGDAKVALIATCVGRRIPIVSSMGAANKLCPGAVRIADIAESRQCPLARAMRKRLRKLGIEKGVTVVYSEEQPVRLAGASGAFQADAADDPGGKRPQGTISTMPALFGLHCASVVLAHLLKGVAFERRGETPRRVHP